MAKKRASIARLPIRQKVFNMKQLFTFLLFIIVFVMIVSSVSAQTTTPEVTKKPTITQKSTDKLNTQINNLKDRIASRVAELQLVEKRGAVGTVTEASSSQMTITDTSDKSIIVDVDEITKFESLANDEDFGISDIKKGMKISVVGNYNKQSKRILARYVDETNVPIYVKGMVASVDDDEGTLTVATEKDRTVTVDVETVTKTSEYADGDIAKSGFSQIEVGDRVAVQGYPDKKDNSRVVATRVLLFPGLPKNPKIVVPGEKLLDDEPVTSTGSGKKLTPVR
jgi:Na+-transporting methylmalonyl-CoA/oxaloacetate decarboxylase gamma subunit